MCKIKYLIGNLLLLILSIQLIKAQTSSSIQTFHTELEELKVYFEIPAMAVLVEQEGKIIYEDYKGLADVENKIQVDKNTTFPVASLTKIFSGVLIMKLVEDKKLDLNTPIKNHLDNAKISDKILIKHVLSHTSQGEIGKKFYYSSRFSWLTKVIEKASGKSFEKYMQEVIFEPLKLKNTFLLKDKTQLENIKIAQPYIFEGESKKGFIDYGFSASAGIVSNAKDLSIFSQALDNNILISKKSKKLMFKSFQKNLPYAYGIFSQKFLGEKLVWAYGQYDCYSSLLLKVPSKKMTLILLANNNLMSDPARLIYGKAKTSLFVLSFLKNMLFKIPNMPLFETENSLKNTPESNQEFYKHKLLAEALSASFMARFDNKYLERSIFFLEKVFDKYPNYEEYADLNVLHTLAFLKDVYFYKELGKFEKFDTKLEKIGQKLLKEDEQNPYIHIYLGNFYDRKGNLKKAKFHFKQIVENSNFTKNWYTKEAKNWLDKNK